MDKVLSPQAQVNWFTEVQRIIEECGRQMGVSISNLDTTRVPDVGEVLWMQDISALGIWLFRKEGASDKKAEIEVSQYEDVPYSSICQQVSNAINTLNS